MHLITAFKLCKLPIYIKTGDRTHAILKNIKLLKDIWPVLVVFKDLLNRSEDTMSFSLTGNDNFIIYFKQIEKGGVNEIFLVIFGFYYPIHFTQRISPFNQVNGNRSFCNLMEVKHVGELRF